MINNFFKKFYEKYFSYVFWGLLLVFVVIFFVLFFNKENITNDEKVVAQGDDSNIKSHDFVNILNKNLADKQITNKKGLIENYCNTIFSDELELIDGFQNMTFYYTPKKSIFLHALCSHLEDFDESKFDETFLNYINDGYLDDILDEPACEYDEENDMSGCRFSYFLPKIFGNIINEVSNVKLASILGISDEDIDDSIEEFSNIYFGESEDIGCDGKYYLYNQDIDDLETMHCQHPDTYEYFSKYLQEILELLTSSKILNPFEIIEAEVENEECQLNFDSDLIVCSLLTNDYQRENLKNLLLNELMFYNLFITYFLQNGDNSSVTEFKVGANISDNIKDLGAEIKALENEISVSQESINRTWDMLQNIYFTFPTHIGFMAYREDLIRFRNEFAKVYTPIHQMYSRFRNVQDTRR
ncbi:hypothetical protein [Candidatus Vampirococcus lugosii]|uniref:Uncharacterized protein n=1 Tax=Candidatus Vampirococcus lugosii TaxID=2789015 RepID=A0ABS5QKH1_9BACT|nr:hypothetical protein [Candidatus Vampirococcus lugosii]MBS8121702.1 hypothetical protein [Candidatus Vampirococcus lugosii]